MNPDENSPAGENAPIQPAELNITPESNPNFTPADIPEETPAEQSDAEQANPSEAPAEQPLEWLESAPAQAQPAAEEQAQVETTQPQADTQPAAPINGVPQATPVADATTMQAPKERKKSPIALIVVILLLFIGGGVAAWFLLNKPASNNNEPEAEPEAAADVKIANHYMFLPKDSSRQKFALFDVESGAKLTDFEYDSDSEFMGGYALVEKDEKPAIINEQGELTVDFDQYKSIRSFDAGLYYAKDEEGNEKIIFGNGTVLADSDADGLTDKIDFDYSDNYIIFNDSEKHYQLYDATGKNLKEFNSEDEPSFERLRGVNYRNTSPVLRYGDNVIVLGRDYYRIEKELEISSDYSLGSYSETLGAISLTKYDAANRVQALYIDGEIKTYSDAPCDNIAISNYATAKDFITCSRNDGTFMIDSDGSVIADYDLDIYSKRVFEALPIIDSKNYLKPTDDGIVVYKDGEKLKTVPIANDVEATLVYGYDAGRYLIIEKDASGAVLSSTVYNIDGEKEFALDTKCNSLAYYITESFGFCANIPSDYNGGEDLAYYVLDKEGKIVSDVYYAGEFLNDETNKPSVVAFCDENLEKCDVYSAEGKKIVDSSKYSGSTVGALDSKTVFQAKLDDKYVLYDMAGKKLKTFDGELDYEDPGILYNEEKEVYTLTGELIYKVDDSVVEEE